MKISDQLCLKIIQIISYSKYIRKYMLLVLMYHRIFGNTKTQEAFLKHLELLQKNYRIVLPGEEIEKNKISFCLTFDDAYYDFYYFVYPLLKKLNLKAVLAVPIKYIINSTNLDSNTRLSVQDSQIMQNTIYKNFVPFCTWQEIIEMVNSGHVEIASHSFNHVDLTKTSDLDNEIFTSKKILIEKLQKEINTFIYPYGKTNKQVQQKVMDHYKYAMRIGSALNLDWNNLIYRVNADKYWQHGTTPSKLDYTKFFLKYLSNAIRNK